MSKSSLPNDVKEKIQEELKALEQELDLASRGESPLLSDNEVDQILANLKESIMLCVSYTGPGACMPC